MPAFNPSIYQLELWSCLWKSAQFLSRSFHWKHVLLDCDLIYTASDNVPWEHSQAGFLSKGHLLTADGDCSLQHTSCVHPSMVSMPRQYPDESCIVLLWLCCWKHQIEIAEEPNRMVGWSWQTFHTLKYGLKVRRVSWGLWICWGSVKGRTERRDSYLAQRNFENHYWTKALPEFHHRWRTDKFVPNKNLENI